MLRHIIGIDVGIKDTIICSDGLRYQMTKNIETGWRPSERSFGGQGSYEAEMSSCEA